MVTLEDVTAALEGTRVSAVGVSFAKKSLKLDTEKDAKPVIDAIDNCKELQFLNLEGNTLGVDASKVIAKALEKHPEFKRAIWKDMFTGRMKTEIPKALEFLGNGLVVANARLVELDLSDNAFGPIGVQGLASLLKSSSCYALEELKLNNNGLGIGGGKLLAGALLECYNSSKQQGKPLSLKVFIAGRNRLENDGAKALAEVFKTIGTLEEIAMPQNGIYHVGMTALSEAFKFNKNLQILNLNDNIIGPKGSKSLSDALSNLPNLKEINFGDCLIKTAGAKLLATGLKSSMKIEQLTFGFNEIRSEGAIELIKSLSNKNKLRHLILDGNQFGEKGRINVKNKLKEIGKLNTLSGLSEDESGDSEDDADDQSTEDETEHETSADTSDIVAVDYGSKVTIDDFVLFPTTDKFMQLGENRSSIILTEAKKFLEDHFESYIPLLMKIAALSVSKKNNVTDAAIVCCELMYREMFTWAQENNNIPNVNNSLLVHLGLIKCEEKKYQPTWNIEGCLTALENVVKKNYFPQSTRDTLKVFLERNNKLNKDYSDVKNKLLSSLT